jgi:mortality factor 4-like protein 1
MGDGASPAFVVGDAVLATHDVFVFGETYSAEVIDTRARDGVAEFKVLRSGSNEKDATWLAVNKMVRDTVDARREAGMLDEPVNEPEGAQEPAKAARAKKPKEKAAKKPKAKPAAKANASEGPDEEKRGLGPVAPGSADGKRKGKTAAEIEAEAAKNPGGYVHYAGDVHCKSARRPGSDAFDMTFHLIDQNGSCYRFRDCDATGKFAPGKTQGFLRSKLAVARFLERDGASGADAAERDAAESAVPAAETSKKKRSEAEPAAAGREKRAKTTDVDATPATLPAAANGEGANVANVANVPLDLSEQEEAGIRVELSASLKRELITQWERVTLQGELLSLPRSVTAAEVLRRFEADAKKKARSAEQAELAADCAAGLKAYFDGALYSSLLYAEEHAQAEAALVSHKNTKRREPSEVYGAEHLLRLFVKLPELMPLRDMDAAAAKAVQAKLTEFVRWMQRNASAHFVSGEYVDARPAAAAKAGEATVAT